MVNNLFEFHYSQYLLINDFFLLKIYLKMNLFKENNELF